MRPSTLIQIHYHNRPGGVTTVMAAYARAFAAVAGPGARVVTVCRDYGPRAGDTGPARIIPVAGCDYHVFRSARAFTASRRRIARALERVVDRESLSGPVCVIAHNLNLGRNPALAAAYADLVRRRSSPGIRFFAVVHDRAEEGRPALLAQLRELARQGVPVWRLLYPNTPELTYVTPAPRIRRILAGDGLAVRTLFDPVRAPAGREPGPGDRRAFRAALARIARCDGVTLPPSRPLAFYPSRVIRRKNVLEAAVVACLALGHALIAGAPGTSRSDRRLCAGVRAACRRLGLPVFIDAGRVVRQPGGPREFNGLYRFADVCISTSVLEGFGYALYEPWAYGRAVVGRRPDGFVPACGVDHSHLYDRMLVPRAWAGGRWKRSSGGMTDFAGLDTSAQVRVLGRLAASAGALGAVRFVRGRKIFGAAELATEVRGAPLRRVVKRNRRVVLTRMGDASFRRAFERCFLAPQRRPLRRTRRGEGPLRTGVRRSALAPGTA